MEFFCEAITLREERMSKWKLTVSDMAHIGMMVAIIEVCKVVLMGVPNIELTTFWIIMFSIYFRNKVFWAIPVFVLIEGAMFGFHIWWIMYLYMWPSLAFLTRLLKKVDSVWAYSFLSAMYGLLFGFFCAIPYVVIGTVDGGIKNGLYAGFTWWVAGIPYDLLHGIGNFVFMLILYRPIRNIMNKLPQISQSS